ncbi:hypothetical protein [Actinoplanes missouriensis]|uniref:hypothetical protein n=1 Tax=Actinoplanes missouriensis TaxID=1866 RepID=UPI0012FA93AE|nr:hypothetical protein [Actinoplanes missouriensis]
MPDRHRDPTVSVRPSQGDKDAAVEALGARGWTLGDALHAALLWLLDDPRRLAELERFRPPPKAKGRPPSKR